MESETKKGGEKEKKLHELVKMDTERAAFSSSRCRLMGKCSTACELPGGSATRHNHRQPPAQTGLKMKEKLIICKPKF